MTAIDEAWTVQLLDHPIELSVAEYDIDEPVIPVCGPFVGQVGVVDELDLADDDKPFRVRFDDLEGEPIAWYHGDDLMPAGGAR